MRGVSTSLNRMRSTPARFGCAKSKEKCAVYMVFTHVDDLLVMADRGLHEELKKKIGEKFPVDDWESEKFEHIGCEYHVTRSSSHKPTMWRAALKRS